MLDALCTKIEPSTLGMWKYNDMDQMPSFINGKFAVIGDAAHPSVLLCFIYVTEFLRSSQILAIPRTRRSYGD